MSSSLPQAYSNKDLFVQSAQTAKPFLKWAGGKSQLLTQYDAYFPKSFDAYHEPFVGGGAVFFHLTPSQAFLSDTNEELINAYLQIKDDVEGLIYALKSHVYDKDYYYRIRGLNPKELTPVQRASRFIFLNKTCFNGLHRVNKSGQFNAPFGKYKNPKILDADNLRSVSKVLSTIDIQVKNFESVLDVAKPGDLVYFDPPYHPTNEKSYFTEYTSVPFDKQQQELLGSVYSELDKRGCLVMLRNA